MSAAPSPVAVRGGVGGITARSEDMRVLAGVLRHVAIEVADVGVRTTCGLAVLADPAADVLDPVGAVTTAADVSAILAGPGGALSLGTESSTLAVSLDAAALAYEAVDQIDTSPATALLRDLLAVPRAVVTGIVVSGQSGSVVKAAQASLSADPGLVGDLLNGIAGGRPTVVAAGLGTWFPDGRPVATPTGVDAVGDVAGPPRNVHDLIGGLARRNDDVPGAVDVRILTTTNADGTVTRQAIVDIPGTKDWSTDRHNPNVTNLGSNLRSLSGEATTYAAGVVAALAAAGVTAGDAVLFVGHSLGGMVAVTAANLATVAGYRVGGIVTAGSPIGAEKPPPGVPVLALENTSDVVPTLDGATNPTGPDEVTVTVNEPQDTIGESHGLGSSYLGGADEVDASDNASIVGAREAIAPFLEADAVNTQTFVISRELP